MRFPPPGLELFFESKLGSFPLIALGGQLLAVLGKSLPFRHPLLVLLLPLNGAFLRISQPLGEFTCALFTGAFLRSSSS